MVFDGIRLQKERQYKNISRKMMAAKLGISISTLRKWETGYAEPNIVKMQEASTAIGCTLQDLCFRKIQLNIKPITIKIPLEFTSDEEKIIEKILLNASEEIKNDRQ